LANCSVLYPGVIHSIAFSCASKNTNTIYFWASKKNSRQTVAV
jgi:hypothetical protein